MKFKLVAFLPLVALPLLACASGDSTVQRDTADFFTRLSQGYRIEVKEQAPLDVMWTFSARENEFQRFADLERISWPRQIAKLTGSIMRNKGVMDGPLFLYFPIDKGEPDGDLRLCQPVETLITPGKDVKPLSLPRTKVIQTIHRGKRSSLGTAYRALEKFAREEGLPLSGMASWQVIRGAMDAEHTSDYLTRVQLYVRQG